LYTLRYTNHVFIGSISAGIVRVGVSSTPGKTKHFQTLMVSDRLMLCDCPGLVFPSFMNSTGEMLCSGILPINQMRDYVSPAQVIASRIPMHLLDACYGIHIKRDLDIKDNPDRPPTAHELLCAYCAVKGYITNGTGRWDEFRACKDLLRDFNDGRILFVAPPMASDGTILINESRWLMETERTMIRNEKIAERLALAKIKEADEQAEVYRKAKEAEDLLIARATSSAASSEMVFGDGKYQFIEDEEALLYGGAEIDEDGNIIETNEAAAEGDDSSKPKRDHKRLKTWGKKNKKLRDKNPYGEENGKMSFVALSTNRVSPLTMGAATSIAPKVKRHDPRQAYGTPYVRTTLPHHPSAAHKDPIAAAKSLTYSRVKEDDVSGIVPTR
jgi:large subunit GTPase 1